MGLSSADNTPVLANDNAGSAGTTTSVGTPGSPGVPGLSVSGVDGTGVIGSPGCVGSAGSNGGVPVTVALFSTLPRSEEHTSELQSLMRISYAVFCLKKKKNNKNH